MALYQKTSDKDQMKFQNSNCGINGVNYTFFFFLTTTFVAEHYRLKHNPNDWSSAKVWTYSMTLFTTTDVRKLGSDLEQTPVKFPHSPSYIIHSVLEQRKQWQKQYIAIGKTDLFYNSMGLCGIFTQIPLNRWQNLTTLVKWLHRNRPYRTVYWIYRKIGNIN